MIEVAAVTDLNKKTKQAAGILAVCVIFLLSGGLMGCTPSSRPLLWYADETFPFRMTLSTEHNTFTMTGERTPQTVTLTLTAPENLAGLTISYTDGSCILSAGETIIPLSDASSEGLTGILDGLLLTSADGAKTGSDADGMTTLTYDTLTLTLDENGLPSVILDGATGRTAQISVSAQSLSDTNNKEVENNEHQTENNSGDLGIRTDP